MKSGNVSRRFAVGALGAGAALGAVGFTVSSASARGTKALGLAPTQGDPQDGAPRATAQVDVSVSTALALVAPLEAGAQLGSWKVERVLPLEAGAVSVICSDAGGQQFQLDVCRRDVSGVRGPGQTEHFDVCLVNHGSGSQATLEDHGLAAMALADVIRSNEQHVNVSSFSTLSERASRARVHLG